MRSTCLALSPIFCPKTSTHLHRLFSPFCPLTRSFSLHLCLLVNRLVLCSHRYLRGSRQEHPPPVGANWPQQELHRKFATGFRGQHGHGQAGEAVERPRLPSRSAQGQDCHDSQGNLEGLHGTLCVHHGDNCACGASECFQDGDGGEGRCQAEGPQRP